MNFDNTCYAYKTEASLRVTSQRFNIIVTTLLKFHDDVITVSALIDFILIVVNDLIALIKVQFFLRRLQKIWHNLPLSFDLTHCNVNTKWKISLNLSSIYEVYSQRFQYFH